MIEPKFTEEPLSVVRLHAWCKCGGEMVATGGGSENANGEIWDHECTKCGAQVRYRSRYPCIKYEPHVPRAWW